MVKLSLFCYELQQVSKTGIIDGDNKCIEIDLDKFIDLNNNLCEWNALCEVSIAGKIFDVNFHFLNKFDT